MEFSLHLPFFLKMHGNEAEAAKTSTVRSGEFICDSLFLKNLERRCA